MNETNPTQERPYPLDHEGRIARLEGVVEQIDVRLGRMETKIDAVDAKIDDSRMSLDAKIDVSHTSLDAKIDANRMSLEAKVDRLYRWMVPLQITTILAIAGLAIRAFSG